MHLGHQIVSTQCRVEEELQSRDCRAEGNWRNTVLDQMQLIASQVLDRGCVRRAPEKDGELTNHPQITGLRLRRESAHAHVIHHVLA